MENKKGENFLSRFLAGLVPEAEGAEVKYKFNPSDNSIMKIDWESPNDGKKNIVNFLLSAEPYTIRIKDNH